MKRLSELQNEKAYYESLLKILEKIHNPSTEEFNTIYKAKNRLEGIIQKFCNNIRKTQERELRLNKYLQPLFVLLFVVFASSVVCFSFVIAGKANQHIVIIPTLLIIIIQIISLLLGLIAISPTPVYFITLALIVAVMLIYSLMGGLPSGFDVSFFLTIITVVNFAFGLYDRMKKL